MNRFAGGLFFLFLSSLLFLAQGDVKITSWNVGFEEIDPAARSVAVLEALKTDTSDIVCLSELFGGTKIIRKYVDTLRPNFPYSAGFLNLNAIPNTTTTFPPGCSAQDLQAFSVCAAGAGCLKGTNSELIACIFKGCLKQFMALYNDQRCWGCIFEGLQSGLPFSSAVGQCALPSDTYSDPYYGLLVLSKVPIVPQKIAAFPYFLGMRGYVSFSVPGMGNTLMACSHLATSDSGDTYLPYFSANASSWAEENLLQSQILTDYFNSQSKDFPNQIIMGDFNHGPGDPTQNITQIAPKSFQYILNSGFMDTTAKAGFPCTFCFGNPVAPYPHAQELIDHFYVRGPFWDPQRMVTRRTYDQDVTIQINSTTTKVTKYSDHFAIQLTLTTPAPTPSPTTAAPTLPPSTQPPSTITVGSNSGSSQPQTIPLPAVSNTHKVNLGFNFGNLVQN